MRTKSDHPDRDTVRTRLDRVTDPELDQSIVELGYVDEVDAGSETFVRFKLPTAWCSPAFAWMMAIDIREQVESIPWVETVTVELVDHLHADEITNGVNEQRAFEAVFPDATDGIEAVRRTLEEKARLSRQYRAIKALRDAGLRAEQLCRLRRADLSFDPETDGVINSLDGVYVRATGEPVKRHLDKMQSLELVNGSEDRLFLSADGKPITPENFESVYRRCRLASVNMGGQAGICEALYQSRYGD